MFHYNKNMVLFILHVIGGGILIPGVEMIALNVGKGDATVIRSGTYTCLIDTGRYSARKTLMADLEYLGISALDAVFISHAHNDHSGALKKLRKSGMPVKEIYASKYHPICSVKEHPAQKNAEKMGLRVKWLAAGMNIPLGDSGAVFHTVAPAARIKGNENDNSLVLLLDSPHGRILLTGDMEKKEGTALLNSGTRISCDVLKVPDHGDGNACGENLIKACSARFAVISTNTEEKPDTPDPKLVNLLKHYEYQVFVTQESPIGIRICLNEGKITAEYISPERKDITDGD